MCDHGRRRKAVDGQVDLLFLKSAQYVSAYIRDKGDLRLGCCSKKPSTASNMPFEMALEPIPIRMRLHTAFPSSFVPS
jgi:hypothetical protein